MDPESKHRDASLQQQLLALELGFWTQGEPHYAEHLAANAVMALPLPAGLLPRPRVLQSIIGAARWQSVEPADVTLTELGPQTQCLSYVVQARRADTGQAYRALIGSIYVHEAGAWKLAFHQQTPA
jgi:hypothetical protein